MDGPTRDQLPEPVTSGTSPSSRRARNTSSLSSQSPVGLFGRAWRSLAGSTTTPSGRGTSILPLFRQTSGTVTPTSAKDGTEHQPEKDVDLGSVPDELSTPPPASLPRTSAVSRPPLHLLTLPPEIIILLLERLEPNDIEWLRCTCRYFKDFTTLAVMNSIFGETQLQEMLLSYCRLCGMKHQSTPMTSLVRARLPEHGSKLTVLCAQCARLKGHAVLKAGCNVRLWSGGIAISCPWCGWPTCPDRTLLRAFHLDCSKAYLRASKIWVAIGFGQMAVGLVAAALAWKYFRNVPLVFAPTVTAFLLLWVCLAIVGLRGRRTFTYHFGFVAELVVLCLWIPPVYVLAKGIAENPGGSVPITTTVTLLFFLLNMLFRLINTIGNLFLCSEYEFADHHHPVVPLWRRIFVNPLATALAVWTYPLVYERPHRKGTFPQPGQ